MILSPHEVADLALKAGFSKTTKPAGATDSEAVCLVAVCCAESGLNTDVIARSTAEAGSRYPGNRDHGLAQISGYWQHERIAAAGGRWRDPAANVAIAYQIFTAAGRSFSPWSVWSGGQYKAWLPDARIAVDRPWPYVDPVAQLQKDLAAVTAELKATRVELAAVRRHFT